MIRAALAAMLALGVAGAGAAELPSRVANAERVVARTGLCEVGGEPGVLFANGTCLRIYGSIATGVSARNVRH